MTQISESDARRFAYNAGFRGRQIDVIVGIAHAESGLDSGASNTAGNVAGKDRGILEINDYYHPEVSDECAYDPACSFRAAFQISNNGTDFRPWATYAGGQYSRFLPSNPTPDDWAPDAGEVAEGGSTLSSQENDNLQAQINNLSGRVSQLEVRGSSESSGMRTATVAEGDTASGIAQAYGLSWDDFRNLNESSGMKPRSGNWDMIYPGEVFRVA